MRSIPVRSMLPPLASIPFAKPFLLRRAACNFISSPFQPSHLRLRRRRILIGNLYRTTRFSLLHLLLFLLRFSLPSPRSPRSGQRALSRKRIWKWVEAMVLTSFGLVQLLFCLPPRNRECIFYNAAMSRWPEVVCYPHHLRLASFGAPVNPRFRRDNLDRPCLNYIPGVSNLIKD